MPMSGRVLGAVMAGLLLAGRAQAQGDDKPRMADFVRAFLRGVHLGFVIGSAAGDIPSSGNISVRDVEGMLTMNNQPGQSFSMGLTEQLPDSAFQINLAINRNVAQLQQTFYAPLPQLPNGRLGGFGQAKVTATLSIPHQASRPDG